MSTPTGKAKDIEFGVGTFGDVTQDLDGNRLSHAQTLRNVVEEGVLADRVGIDYIGVGEHHRPDFAVSAPETVLAAIAARTERIKVGTAVTVLSSDDPIRVFQRFSTLHGISEGRAEMILGRGSFTESFPLFGYDLADYEVLFEEKLDLLSHILTEKPVTWSGTTRKPLRAQRVYPATDNGPIRAWIGVGGSPESVVRAARYGMPLMLAIIGGDPARFAPYPQLFRNALAQLGKEPLPVGVHSPGHVAATDEEAVERFWPHHQVMRDRIGAERGWGPTNKEEYLHEIEHGSLYVGSPETVARKIARTLRILGADRFELKYSAGPLPHEYMMDTIRLYGEQVVPMVRELLAK